MRGLFIGGTLAGVLLGLGLGVALAWFYWPVPFQRANPADLRLDLKDDYLIMIASSYSLDGDMARALQRLDTLNLPRPDKAVTQLVEGETKPLSQQALIHLALDLRQPSVALARPTYTPRPTRARPLAQPEPTALPHVTPTPAPSLTVRPPATSTSEPTSAPATLAPNLDAPLFRVMSRTALSCSQTQGHGLIEVDIQDPNGLPLPGIGVEVSWGAGEEIFYTGFKPERGMGYADVELSAGTYSLQLAEDARSDVVGNLRIDSEPSECTYGSEQVRGWILTFQRNG